MIVFKKCNWAQKLLNIVQKKIIFCSDGSEFQQHIFVFCWPYSWILYAYKIPNHSHSYSYIFSPKLRQERELLMHIEVMSDRK